MVGESDVSAVQYRFNDEVADVSARQRAWERARKPVSVKYNLRLFFSLHQYTPQWKQVA
jgi:hypothetical protein